MDFNRMKKQNVWIGLALVLTLAAGCLTENNFNDRLARDLCQRLEECSQADFEAQFDSVGECVDESTQEDDPATQCLEAAGCKFDRSGARDCRQAVRSGSCADFAEAEWANDCDEVYDCTAEQQQEFVECITDFDG